MSETEEGPTLRLVEPAQIPAPVWVMILWAAVVVACIWVFALLLSIVAPLIGLLVLATPDGRAACSRAYENWPREKKE